MFKPVSPKVNFPELEKKILKFWQKEKIFEKTQKKKNGQKNFVFYEGPPTANGRPGIHHVLARSFKDLYPRYKTMRGFYCLRRGGWDCHGLPVELEIEKELGFSGKKDIEQYGIAEFNQKCKESVFRYIKDWEDLTRRMGFWIDLKNSYFTLANEYIESCWGILKEFYQKELLVRDYKVLPYCSRCGTPLSSHELAQGYEDTQDVSVFLKFELKDEPGTYLLAWTTTPWTLPGNVALAVDPEACFVKVKLGDQKLILAKSRIEVVGEKFEIEEEFKGRKLLGKFYKPLFDFVNYDQKSHFVIDGADFVSMEEGTGIVHTAVMYGAEDFAVGKKFDLPQKHTVSIEGKFTDEVKPWAGMDIFKANPLIVQDLNERDLLYKEELIVHSYPFCWRCHSPLIYYALESWFIKTTARKEEIIVENQKINWVPASIREGRMGNWLATMIDWALSRSRYWGTPLPIWICEKCQHVEVIGSIAELKKQSINWKFTEESLDLHRPFVDEVKIKCRQCGEAAKRVEYVLDCWFDSGAMPYAQWHYPFENRQTFNEQFPADFIAEGQDQTRGWFYTLLVISTLFSGKASFRNVISHNLVLDEKGQKMSKSQGNVLDPWEVMDKFGADATRWYFYSSVALGNDYRFGFEAVESVVRRFFLTLWNVYNFFITYANVDKWEVKSQKSRLAAKRAKVKSQNVLDRWIISQLNQLIQKVTQSLDKYDAFTASRVIEDFVVNDLSTWYVRRSRDRVGPTALHEDDKDACYATLHEVLITLSGLLAPFAPFVSEEIYKSLTDALSVHLIEWPQANISYINISYSEQMDLVRKICELSHAQRKEKKIKVRQPLQSIKVGINQKKLPEDLLQLIKEELNIKDVEWTQTKIDQPNVSLNTGLTPELRAEGEARELIREIQEARKNQGCALDEKIIVYAPTWPKDFEDYIKKQTLAEKIVEGEELKIERKT